MSSVKAASSKIFQSVTNADGKPQRQNSRRRHIGVLNIVPPLFTSTALSRLMCRGWAQSAAHTAECTALGMNTLFELLTTSGYKEVENVIGTFKWLGTEAFFPSTTSQRHSPMPRAQHRVVAERVEQGALKTIEPPPPIQSDEIFVNICQRSTGWGIGFTYNACWLAWKYMDGWFCEGCCIGQGEMPPSNLCSVPSSRPVCNMHNKLGSDNQGV
ncbi:hypothetical protein B0H13DRAFT_1855990 [Mycena leptocephala]|nr:hypothetical protein B0H13DRAFT_1855990 [Mycena leptocephala]